MVQAYRHGRPTLGVLAGWQFYRTATNLSYLTPVFRGVCRAAQDLGCNLLFGCGIGPSASPNDPLRPAWPFPSSEHDFVPIGPWNTDGLIIASPLHSQQRSQYVQTLIAAGHPILFIGSGEAGPTIVADNTGGILNALRHLVEHGHRQVAFIAGTPEDLGGDTGDRLKAYQHGCEIYGLEQDPRLVVYGRHVYDGGFLAMQQIITSGVNFTAVLASNDESALGAMQALKQAGRSIPQDVAVIGFDNRLEGAVSTPALSSVHVPLFSIGYRAVDQLLQKIETGVEITAPVHVETRLVLRESCGCGGKTWTDDEMEPPSQAQLTRAAAKTILNQAYGLTEVEGHALCQSLFEAFVNSIQIDNSARFQQTLSEVLERTAAGGDDTHIWQDAITVLEQGWRAAFPELVPKITAINEMVNNARLVISAQMQSQHRQYVVRERWVASRLSLLTGRLLSALDEEQIYEILAKHLPDMDIHQAMLGLFEEEGSDPVAFCTLRNVIDPEQELVRLPSRKFPPAGYLSPEQPLILTIIPVVGQTGQIGFMVFGADHFDLYGVVVQQVGGALNTAWLYRQATEGRRLAEQANRMKSRFLSTISHELRTPLNLILGLSGILIEENDEGKAPLPAPVQRDIERIHAYAQHLGGLIGDVLDLATSDAGQLRLSMELMDLGEALRLVAESGSQLAADKGLAWRASIPENGPWVRGDRTRLRQVVLNFVNNAIKFTSQGEVSLVVEYDNEAVTVCVRDTGLGIPLEEQAVIFDEFHRSERSISLGYPGLGLGLAICKLLIEMHEGTVKVESSGVEGEGSAFSFTLPVVSPPAQATASILARSERQRVLVLTQQQDPGDWQGGAQLSQHGIQVQTAQMEPFSAWQTVLADSPPDAILLDVSSGSELGWNVLKEIKNSQPAKNIPVLFITASSDGGSLLNLDFLTKPIELSNLTHAIDRIWLLSDSGQSVRTFLVVDDEPDTLEMHARIIRSQASMNRVLLAQNGLEALDILQKEKVDIVLLDLQMPGMDGFGVLEAMRDDDKLREIPVIVLTGKVLTETEMARLNQEVSAVLGKGLFSMDEIVEHIQKALERKRRLSIDAQRLVRQAMAYLHVHYAEPISRHDIAQHVFINDDYLTFCFRQELGITPIRYLQRYRISKAKELLKSSKKTITEIAYACGFSDSGYFSRIFRRETGMPPEEFRLS